jgi:hypothetical protein
MPNRVEKVMDIAIQEAIVNHIKSATDLMKNFNVTRKQIGDISGQNMGTGSGVLFIQKAFTIAVENPDIMTALYNRAPYELDINFYNAMKPIVDAVAGLNSALNETIVLLGHDLMEHANAVLKKLRGAAEDHEGAYRVLYNDLNVLYENRAKLTEERKATNQVIADLTGKVAAAEAKAR